MRWESAFLPEVPVLAHHVDARKNEASKHTFQTEARKSGYSRLHLSLHSQASQP
jgi:hypothetical protein